ncbi:hypothetical protein [Chamaesiphon sp. OTE_75_metabat_556]|nr:hypothetical protein [Chamaesiphon sp. OTE_75_metabat_556]
MVQLVNGKTIEFTSFEGKNRYNWRTSEDSRLLMLLGFSPQPNLQLLAI